MILLLATGRTIVQWNLSSRMHLKEKQATEKKVVSSGDRRKQWNTPWEIAEVYNYSGSEEAT